MMIPELPELPEIREHSTRAIRLRGTIQTPLPAMQNLDLGDYYAVDPRIAELARFQEAMRIAYEITRRQNRIQAARASYADRMLQYQAERKRGWWR